MFTARDVPEEIRLSRLIFGGPAVLCRLILHYQSDANAMNTPKELGFTRLLIMGLLAERGQASGRELLDRYRAEYEFRGVKETVYVELARLEDLGYVGHEGTPRIYALTDAGVRVYREQLAFLRAVVDRFGSAIAQAAKIRRPKSKPQLKREPIAQRRPTLWEWVRILDGSPPGFRAIAEAALAAEIDVWDLAVAEIEGIDLDRGILLLPAVALSGRPIASPELPLAGDFARLAREAVGDRTAGPIWTTAKGERWTASGLSGAFARARKGAGLPAGIVLSGRGGGKREGRHE